MATKRTPAKPAAKPESDLTPVIVVNKTFKWAAIINCIICATTLTVMIVLALFSSQDKPAERLFPHAKRFLH